jgi:hypothetical protein
VRADCAGCAGEDDLHSGFRWVDDGGLSLTLWSGD